jgi:uncharacterized membrane protein
VAVHLSLTFTRDPGLQALLRGASFVTHAALYLGLLVVFGRTLLPGREPLVTRLARRFEDPLPPVVARYTRGVTWAWALFAAGQLAGSALLLCLAPAATWSLFVNALEWPLIAAMFAAEYACRVAIVPRRHRVGAVTAVRAFLRRDAAPAAS